MHSFREWLKHRTLLENRTAIKFGYPDGYGEAQYPIGYHAAETATYFFDVVSREEQEDIAPPNTALADPAADKSQAAYRKKMGVLPPISGEFITGFIHQHAGNAFHRHYPRHTLPHPPISPHVY